MHGGVPKSYVLALLLQKLLSIFIISGLLLVVIFLLCIFEAKVSSMAVA